MIQETLIKKIFPSNFQPQIHLVISFAILFQFFFTTVSHAQSNYPLIDSSNFEYAGAFRLPQARGDSGFAYGGSAMTYNPINNSLILVGNVSYQRVAEVSIPHNDSIIKATSVSSLKIANFTPSVTHAIDITEGNLNKVGEDGASISAEVRIGGLLVYNKKLIGNTYIYYDAGYRGKRSHFFTDITLTTSGNFQGYYTLGTVNPGLVAGYMAPVPPEWQSAFGGKVITGQFGLSIITRSSFGPALFAFNPEDMGTGAAPLKSLVYYPSDHPALGKWDNETESNIYYNMTSESGGVLFPKKSRSVLFIGSQGFGIPGYGLGTIDSSLHRTLVPGYTDVYYIYDPDRISKGCHAYPYYFFVWAYDASQLAQAAAGSVNPWDIRPYAVWKLPLPFAPSNKRISIGGVGYDSTNQIVYICQKNSDGSSDRPIIHVYKMTQYIQESLLHNNCKIQNQAAYLRSCGTTIKFSITNPGHYCLSVFSTNGRLVETVMDDYLSVGNYSKYLGSSFQQYKSFAHGMYLIQLSNRTTHTNSTKMISFEKQR